MILDGLRAGWKSGREGIGWSRGGPTTKIHLTADLRCRQVARLTSPGQHDDSPRFIPLMDAIRIVKPSGWCVNRSHFAGPSQPTNRRMNVHTTGALISCR
jgi:hypothetical protein